ncbi:hypothetical protein Syun_019200 [Stephania yunnanensis]|uniref:Uncharacterized protein n=1 Tax=Stephania yunnanensis TaxID=152371 RepID=A0AAP0NWG3_9MAGN
MEVHYNLDEKFSNNFGRKWVSEWQKVSILAEAIDDNQDGIEPPRRRKTLNKIHGNILPYPHPWRYLPLPDTSR